MGLDSIRTAGVETRGVTECVYRAAGSRDWKPLGTYSSVGDRGVYPVAVDGQANVAYVLEKLDGRDASG